MANLNKVILIGRLTRDPELRRTPSGTAVAEFRLAINRLYTNADGQSREETCFVDVNVWGRGGEAAKAQLVKGREVFVEGRLKMDAWESKDGQKRSKLKVVAEGFQILGQPGGERGGERGGGRRGDRDRERDGGRRGGRDRPPASEAEPPDELLGGERDASDPFSEPLVPLEDDRRFAAPPEDGPPPDYDDFGRGF